MKIDTVFCDLDGVLVNFVEGARKALIEKGIIEPITYQQMMDKWPRGTFELHDVFNKSEKEIWDELDKLGEDFWAGLVPTHDAWSIWSMASIPFNDGEGSVVICTSPSHDPGSAAGKVRWMQRHLTKNFRAFIITPVKHTLARPGAVLIDDSDEKVNTFRKAGGKAILVPRPWNSDYQYAHSAEQVVKLELRKLGGYA